MPDPNCEKQEGFVGDINTWIHRAFSLDLLRKERMQWVDYLRGIAILMVVYRHALIGIERVGIKVPELLMDANMVFYSFRMPLFFILSGLFINSSLGKRTLRLLVRQKFEYLLYPYLIWSLIQVSLQVALSDFTNTNRSLLDYTYILYQPRYLDQFWYLPALFNTTIIYVFLKKKLHVPVLAQAGIGLLLYFLSPYCIRVSMVSDTMAYYIFFALGDATSRFFFRDRVQRFFKRGWSLVGIIPVFALAQYFYLTQLQGTEVETVRDSYSAGFSYLDTFSDQVAFLAIALIGCAAMFILAFRLDRWKIFPGLRILGYHSLHIYVMHVIIIAAFRILLANIFDIREGVALLFVCFTLGVSLPILIYNLFIKDNTFYFLFYLKRRRATSLSAGAAEVRKDIILPAPQNPASHSAQAR